MFDVFLYLDSGTKSFEFLAQANNKSERVLEIFFKYIMGFCFFGTMNLIFFSFLYCWIWVGHFDVEHVYRPDRLV